MSFDQDIAGDALEIELDLLRKKRLESAARGEWFRPVDAPPAARAGSEATNDAGEQEQLMAAFSITFDGRQYQYAQYRYDRFDDALGYARRQPLAPPASDAADSLPPARLVQAPGELERKQMAGLEITFEDGVYRLGPYRYDRLADAIGYARVLEIALAFPGSIRNPTPRASLS